MLVVLEFVFVLATRSEEEEACDDDEDLLLQL